MYDIERTLHIDNQEFKVLELHEEYCSPKGYMIVELNNKTILVDLSGFVKYQPPYRPTLEDFESINTVVGLKLVWIKDTKARLDYSVIYRFSKHPYEFDPSFDYLFD